MHMQTEEKFRRSGTLQSSFCTKGFTQGEGIDFNHTLEPVAKMSSIRVILPMTTTHGLEFQQADEDTSFMYGDIYAHIYMKQPTGFVEPWKEHLVSELKKYLYCTRQAVHHWYLSQECMTRKQQLSC
jgi:hypothetical protein